MDVNGYLAVGQIVSIVLFVLSEIIGKSNCKATGVVEFVWQGFSCFCHHHQDPEDNKDSSSYIHYISNFISNSNSSSSFRNAKISRVIVIFEVVTFNTSISLLKSSEDKFNLS